MFCSSYLGVFHFPLLRNQRLITIVSSEASGAAKPMVKRLAPAIPLKIHVAGTRTAKAQKMLFIIVKVVWPQTKGPTAGATAGMDIVFWQLLL